MAKSKRRDTDTGNGHTKTPILATEKDPTAGELKPSRTHTSIGDGSTKPVSMAEALSLLQTICFDLQSLGCKLQMVTRNNRFYLIGEVSASIGVLGLTEGHITLNNKPVLLGDTGKEAK